MFSQWRSWSDAKIGGVKIPEYSVALFAAFLDEMKVRYNSGSLWVNRHDLNKNELSDIREAIFGKGMLFDNVSIDKSEINEVQQYEWTIDGDEYEKCKGLAVSEKIESPRFVYNVNGDCIVHFHFNFYGHIDFEGKQYCGIFVEIDEMPVNVKRMKIEIDMKCNEKKKYRQLMRRQVLTQDERVCGFHVFETAELEKNDSLKWIFAVKIFNVKMTNIDDANGDEENENEWNDLYKTLADLY